MAIAVVEWAAWKAMQAFYELIISGLMALLLVVTLFLCASLAINGNIEEMRSSSESYGKTWYNNTQELEEVVKSLEDEKNRMYAVAAKLKGQFEYVRASQRHSELDKKQEITSLRRQINALSRREQKRLPLPWQDPHITCHKKMNQLQQELDSLRAAYVRTEPRILPTLAIPPKLVPDSAVSAGLAPTTSGQVSGQAIKEDRLTSVVQQQPLLSTPDPQVTRIHAFPALKRKNSFTDTHPAKKLLDLPMKPQPRVLLSTSTTINALGAVMNIMDQRVDQMDWQLESTSVLRSERLQPVYHPQILATVGAFKPPSAFGKRGQDDCTGRKADGYCAPPPPEEVGMDIDSYKQKIEDFFAQMAAGSIPAPPDDSDSEFE